MLNLNLPLCLSLDFSTAIYNCNPHISVADNSVKLVCTQLVRFIEFSGDLGMLGGSAKLIGEICLLDCRNV